MATDDTRNVRAPHALDDVAFGPQKPKRGARYGDRIDAEADDGGEQEHDLHRAAAGVLEKPSHVELAVRRARRYTVENVEGRAREVDEEYAEEHDDTGLELREVIVALNCGDVPARGRAMDVGPSPVKKNLPDTFAQAAELVHVEDRVNQAERNECKGGKELDEGPLYRVGDRLERALRRREVEVEREGRKDGKQLHERCGPRDVCRHEDRKDLRDIKRLSNE